MTVVTRTVTGSSEQDQDVLDAIRPLVDALGGDIVPADDPGAVVVDWEGQPLCGVRLPQLHGSMERLLAVVETELGDSLPNLTREQQQVAIRRLDELGAFTLRRAVEDISRAIGISRITVYNYLNALYR